MRSVKLVVVLICIYFSPCRAQDTLYVDPVKIDSLKTLLKESSKEDTERVRLLNEFARLSFYNRELIQGFEATIKAIQLSKKIGYKEGEVLYHETLAAFLGDGDMVAFHHQKARMLNAQLSKSDSFAEVQVPEGYPDPITDAYSKKLIDALEHFKDVDQREILATIYTHLGYYYFGNERFIELKSVHAEAIDIYKELEELYPIFLYYSYGTYLAYRMGDNDEMQRIDNEIQKLVASIQDNSETGPLNFILANYYARNNKQTVAIEHYLKCIDFFESIEDYLLLASVYSEMTNLYTNLEMFSKAAEAMENRIRIIETHGLKLNNFAEYNRAMWTMYDSKNYIKAYYYRDRMEELITEQNKEHFLADNYSVEGHILLDQKKFEDAIPLLKNALEISLRINRFQSDEWEAFRLADCYYQIKDYNNALKYALKSEELLDGGNLRLNRNLNLLLSDIYDARNNEILAYKHLKNYANLIKESQEAEVASLIMRNEVRSVLEKKEKEIDLLEQEQELREQENKAQRLWIISIAGALLTALLLSLILYRNNKNRQKANRILQKQKERIQETLTELKATQSQLIQSEKMASLGELTAGIAHEIQNPLNFVNNFSEVNSELIEEMLEELEKGNLNEVKSLSKDIDENEQKIIFHGKRADSIVKGMLQHSRSSDGKKEPVDINILCDEYLRLSYHGLRAKDKSFNATMKTEFDEQIGKINIVAQDIGRVVLNLITNAFHAVDEKKKGGAKDYEPRVTVRTEKLAKNIKIMVKDNANGVPKEILDKIFQPFFTTKPTGQGTGLGLSLSYDIVKAHGGELQVETKKDKGTTFSILLPIG
ncbi:GHKL domain-containing protein [Lutimonas saemankumensis]|uniref:ATP-binding protein n=1 Tax=Lutimonas saemankumensis TaxID=483016 RepID=UPI001CD29297|nr:ATP-binding protein [Lutimonas saemankumensis]MCA0930865.1 GHKL domain-containing protein [Lutimonas saemankumensis]